MRTALGLTVAGLLACAYGAAPVAAAKERPLDYEKVVKAKPALRALSDAAAENGKQMHVLVDEIANTDSEEAAAKLRTQLGDVMQKQLDTKIQMVQLSKDLLRIPRSSLTDAEIFDKIHETELHDIHWRDANFDKCVRDLSRALRIPARLHYRVVQKNKVTFDFRRTAAESVLSWLCNGFDLRYIVYDGEIVVFKKITPTEERFLKYQEKHPEAKLKYWERETAGGEYKIERKGADNDGDAGKWNVGTLDLGLLQENLLKIWIIEQSSELHNQRRIAQKSFELLTPPESTGDPETDRKNAAARKRLDWELRHYMLLELDGAIEEIDILQRVLGKNLSSDPKDRARRRFLSKDAPTINWRNKDLESALQAFGREVGTRVELRGVPKTYELKITLGLEGATVGVALGYIVGIHPMKWTYEDGLLVFDYQQAPDTGGGR